jgi:phosphoribosylamine--glycine ligase
MGAYSPVAALDETRTRALGDAIFAPTLEGLRAEGIDYRGVLYAGLMICGEGPRLLEFNCRFGDPEIQALLPRLEGDFAGLLAGAAAGALPKQPPVTREGAAITVVLASAGYPGSYETGFPIEGLDISEPDTQVFHAGTRLAEGRILTAGGRVLAVTALGRDLPQAADRCYRRVDGITFPGRSFRRDIGWRVLSKGGSR